MTTTVQSSTNAATTPTTEMIAISETTATIGTTATTDTTSTTDTTVTTGTTATIATAIKTTTPLFNEIAIPDVILASSPAPTDKPLVKLGLENPTPTSDSLMLRPSRFYILGISILLKFLLNF